MPSAPHRASARRSGVPEGVLDVEVLGDAVPADRVRELASLALGSAGIADGHLAVEFVDAGRIAALNAEHRGRPEPTDVLSFPMDALDEPFGPRELGDVVICPEHTVDLEEAVVHGVLHLTGMDHETDDGEMLAVQAEIMEWLR
jgi:probable rRNA maturation factor